MVVSRFVGRRIMRRRWTRPLLGPVLAVAAILIGIAVVGPGTAAAAEAEIAAIVPTTGDAAGAFGTAVLQGLQLAIDESNARRGGPAIRLTTYDDAGDPALSLAAANAAAASGAILTVGPVFSTGGLAAGPIFAAAGLASLCAACTADDVSGSATTFRMVFRNSQQGALLAVYVDRALGLRNAKVLYVDDAYGRSLRTGFETMAESLHIASTFYGFTTADEAEAIAREVATNTSGSAIVLLMQEPDAAVVLPVLRRRGVEAPILGSETLGQDSFSARLDGLGVSLSRGSLAEGLYAIAPIILDSAESNAVDFAARYRARYGEEPSWLAMAGYDAGVLAVAAVTAVEPQIEAGADTATQRAAVLDYIRSRNGPNVALAGALGPIWFDPYRGRQVAMRVGRFTDGRFESAPIQFVPAPFADPASIGGGAAFDAGSLGLLRPQRIVHAGIYLNEIRRIDLSASTFEADFFVWLRYAPDGRPNALDPSDIEFPRLVDGVFPRDNPEELRVASDGLVYGLWRVQGTFRNDFDLRRFPFDSQFLHLSFFNANASGEDVVYVLDRAPMPATGAAFGEVASSGAFRNLTQWNTLAVDEARQVVRTESPLGDPDRLGFNDPREQSGFDVTIELERKTVATVAKALLPLFLMGLIMLASLYFPRSLVREKVAVAVTAALSAAVLLTSINTQLGDVAYTVTAEYAFFLFFALSLLCIVTVVLTETHHAGDRLAAVARIQFWARAIYITVSSAIAIAAFGLYLTM